MDGERLEPSLRPVLSGPPTRRVGLHGGGGTARSTRLVLGTLWLAARPTNLEGSLRWRDTAAPRSAPGVAALGVARREAGEHDRRQARGVAAAAEVDPRRAAAAATAHSQSHSHSHTTHTQLGGGVGECGAPTPNTAGRKPRAHLLHSFVCGAPPGGAGEGPVRRRTKRGKRARLIRERRRRNDASDSIVVLPKSAPSAPKAWAPAWARRRSMWRLKIYRRQQLSSSVSVSAWLLRRAGRAPW